MGFPSFKVASLFCNVEPWSVGSELTLKGRFGIGFQADDGFICKGTQGRWCNRHPPLLPEMWSKSHLLSPWTTLSWGKAHLYWDPVSMSVASSRATLFGVQPAPHPKSCPSPVVEIWEATAELWDSEPRRAILGQEASTKGAPQQGCCRTMNQQRVRAGPPITVVPEGWDVRSLPTLHTWQLDTVLTVHCCDCWGFTVGFKVPKCGHRGALGEQFISLLILNLLGFSISSWVSFGNLCVSRNESISSRLCALFCLVIIHGFLS